MTLQVRFARPHRRIGRRGSHGALALGILAALITIPAPPAHAEEAAESSVSWAVAPADESGSDGRSAAEHEVDPGEAVTDHLEIRNIGATDAEFEIGAADGHYTDNGRFTTLPPDQPSTDAGTWITSETSIAVPAGESVIVPYTVTVPESATPGDHAAGIAAALRTSSDSSTIGVTSRVGFRVLVRVTGELAPSVAVEATKADYQAQWNPFRPGRMSTEYTVTNTGNVALTLHDEFDGIATDRGDILPDESRTFVTQSSSVWPTFRISKALSVHGVAPGDSEFTAAAETTVAAWAVPWSQILTLLGAALIVWAIITSRRRSTARLERVVDEAREQGRREALATPGEGSLH